MNEPMKRIAWGVLSTAKIGTQKVIPGMLNGKRGVIAATIAPRTRVRTA